MEFMKFMAEWGIWDIIGLIGGAVPTILLLCYIFPRKAITNFYIDTRRDSINQGYPKVVRIKMRNLTNEPIYFLSEGFKFGSIISASPNAAKNAATKICEVKFEGRQQNLLSEIDTLIRPNQEVSTWVPVNPIHSDQDIDAAIQSRSVGSLRLKCQRMSGRRNAPIRLKISV
jgi:hypothetical protein